MGDIINPKFIGVLALTRGQFNRVCSGYKGEPALFFRIESLADVKKHRIDKLLVALTTTGGGFTAYPFYYSCVKYLAEKNKITTRSEKRRTIRYTDFAVSYQELMAEKVREQSLEVFLEIGS